MGDLTQEFEKYGAEQSVELYCKEKCRGKRPHVYRGLLKAISDKETHSFVYGCVTCSTPQKVEPNPGQLELILKAMQGKNGSF